MKTGKLITAIIVFSVLSCNNQNDPSFGESTNRTGNTGGGSGNKISDGWLIPSDKVFDGRKQK